MDNGIVESCTGFDGNEQIYTVYSPGGIASDPVRISVPDKSGLRNMADTDIDEVLVCGDGSDRSPATDLRFADIPLWRPTDITEIIDGPVRLNGPMPAPQIVVGRFGECGGVFQRHWNNIFTVMTPDIPVRGMGKDHPQEWTLFGSGDFDGNGRDGLLWIENATGCVYMHNDVTSMDEVENRTNCLGVLEDGYSLKGAGDFSGSGIAGVLLQGPQFGDPSVSTNYGLSVWARKEDGTTFVGWLGALVNTWQEGDPLAGDLDDPDDINARNYRYEVVGIGDFNGDGVDDVMIRNTMPANVDGRAVTGAGDVMTFITGDEDAIVVGADPTVCCVGRVTGDWEIVGIGDFDGDGVKDVLLSDGKSMAGWRMSEGRRQSDFAFGEIADGLKCVGVTDVNGDGTDDILFHSTGNQITAWAIRDGVVTGTIALP